MTPYYPARDGHPSMFGPEDNAGAPPPNQGIADTLDEAKEAFKKRYEQAKRR
jgi:hypothetical protein